MLQGDDVLGPERYALGLAPPAAPELVWRRAGGARRGRVTWHGYLAGRAFAAVYRLAGVLVLEVARRDRFPYTETCLRVSAAKARASELARTMGGAP